MNNEKIKVVECVDLEKKYFLFDKDYKVIPWLFTKKGCSQERIPLTNINLTINEGDVIGFVGKNGAGKSTLMKIIAGITAHTKGYLTVNGKVNSLINLGAGFNPKYTGRQNIYYKGLLMGMSKSEIDEIIDEIIDFCELGDYFDLPLYMYSSGMSARLGFALAIFAEHDILIVDEVFAVGDKMFREKSAKKMEELFRSGKSIIFASHSDEQIRQFCTRAILIDDSQIIVDGTVDEALGAYNKKYFPDRVIDETEERFAKFNNFLNSIKGKYFENADLLREIALLCERENDLELAYRYMLSGKVLRPDGRVILEKCAEYENKSVKSEVNESSFENLNNMYNYLMTNNKKFEKADLVREIAVFYELEGNIAKALSYMNIARELRPEGELIKRKCSEYENMLSVNL